MNAVSILEKIRQRGFIIQAEGNAISLKPKHLVSVQIIHFIKKYKEALLTALYQEQDLLMVRHNERKHGLDQRRYEVLRLSVRRLLDSNQEESALDRYLAKILMAFNYDLEMAITHIRKGIIESEESI